MAAPFLASLGLFHKICFHLKPQIGLCLKAFPKICKVNRGIFEVQKIFYGTHLLPWREQKTPRVLSPAEKEGREGGREWAAESNQW